MRISYISLKGMPLGGGIEKYTEELGSRLVQKGHDVTVYTMRHYGASSGEYKGMRIRTVPTIRGRSCEKLMASSVSTIIDIVKRDSDIVHFHAFGPSMFCVLSRLSGKKVVVQGHGIEWQRAKWGRLGRLFLRLSEVPSVVFPNRITVVSRVLQGYLKDTYGIEAVYIPTGVNEPVTEQPNLMRRFGLSGNDYILFAARLVREKGAHYLLRAYESLRTDCKLVIAGDAQHEERYKAELHALAKGNRNIIFTGFVTGQLLHELFSNCLLFVLPSEVEGLPTALLEAMSYGNCCLVSDIPENLEALQGHGYTFTNGNIESLSRRLGALLNDEESRTTVKDKAKEHVLTHHSWDDIALKFESLYGALVC